MLTQRTRLILSTIIVGVILIIFAIYGITDYGTSVPTTKDSRSDEFKRQARVAYDAIRRYKNAGGLAVSLARLDAAKEMDALDRIAKTVGEDNADRLLRNYLFAVDMARVNANEKNIKALAEASVAAIAAY